MIRMTTASSESRQMPSVTRCFFMRGAAYGSSLMTQYKITIYKMVNVAYDIEYEIDIILKIDILG